MNSSGTVYDHFYAELAEEVGHGMARLMMGLADYLPYVAEAINIVRAFWLPSCRPKK